MVLEVSQCQALRPVSLMQVHEHALLKLCLPVVDRDRVVVPVQAMDKCLNGRFVDVSDVGCRLAGFLAGDDGLGLNQTESVDNHLSFHGLDRVNDNSH